MVFKKEQKQGTINSLKVRFNQDVISSKFYGANNESWVNSNQKPIIFMNGDTLWLRELFPNARMQGYQIEMEKVIKFSKENFDGVGWKEMKTLPDLGNLYDCKISLPTLQSTVFSRWTGYGHFATDDATGQEFTVKNSFVFAYDGKIFVYGVSTDDVVMELCVDYTFVEPLLIEIMTSALYTFGVKYNLMLADWRSKDIVDLSNEQDVFKYLNKLKN